MTTTARGSTVMANGVVTIPLAIREKLHLQPNDTVVFEERDGEVFIRKLTGIMRWHGVIKVSTPIDAHTVREAAEAAWTEDASKGLDR